LPIYEQANRYADGQQHTLPDDFYSSQYFIDKTIEFISSNVEDDKPCFAYIPFQAVHMPVRAPREFSDKYTGVYDEGWTVMRNKRRVAAERAGIIPRGTETVVTPGTLDWDSLSEEQKRHHARRMEVYAGMVDAMDMHIGRLMTYLESIGEYDKLGGNSALFKGDYKIVINRTQRETEWGLFNIRTDPGEATNIAQEQPDLLNEMLADYENYVRANNVLPMPEGYNRTGSILGEALIELRQQ